MTRGYYIFEGESEADGKFFAEVRVGVKNLFIEPGSPWENGYNENSNSKLRDEILNTEIFYTLKEAKVLIEK